MIAHHADLISDVPISISGAERQSTRLSLREWKVTNRSLFRDVRTTPRAALKIRGGHSSLLHRDCHHMFPVRVLVLVVSVATQFGFCVSASAKVPIYLAQGTMSGEVTDSTALVQARLTATDSFRRARRDSRCSRRPLVFSGVWVKTLVIYGRPISGKASPQHDFIVRERLSDLQPSTRYYYRAVYGENHNETHFGPTCSFKTLPGPMS